MAVNIVTGRKGEMHITSDDERMRNAEIYGDGKFVFDCGGSNRRFTVEYTPGSLNVRVKSGMMMSYGTQMGIEPYDYVDLTFDSGAFGYQRHDYIAMQYERDLSNDTESAELVIIKGAAVQQNPHDPEFQSGNILKGEIFDQTPLFRVIFDGTDTGIKSIDCVYRLRNGLTPIDPTDPSSDVIYDPTIPIPGGQVTGGVITPEDIDRIWGGGLEDGDDRRY